jgi:uncharacterized protein YndB with AHSA1/START domain
MARDTTMVEPAPLRTSRFYAAPPARVFAAWSTTGHVRAWFCPTGYTVPDARVEMRVGGAFEVCMRAPDGTEHWTRGIVAACEPGKRLVLDLRCEDAAGHVLFGAWTEIDFIAEAGGTRLAVFQRYTIEDPAFAWMPSGAPQGWAQTLDKLEGVVARIPPADGEMADALARSVAHGMFELERVYDAPAGRVFRAFADMEAKRRWFAAPSGEWEQVERSCDFRVGGREILRGRWKSGLVTTFDATYHDIVPGERIVYAYTMHMDARKISVSLATVQIAALGERRTRLRVTEQGAFLDGYDDAGAREHGTGILLDMLGRSLAD